MHKCKSKNKQINKNKFYFHIPTILSDELWEGYYGRFGTFNGVSSKIDTGKMLHDYFRKTPAETSPISMLAELLQFDIEFFVNNHSLIPITKYVEIKNPADNKVDERSLRLLGSKTIKHWGCFCEECVKEDINYLGFSFWRRSHQLPGIDWCQKHQIPLCESLIKDNFFQQPAFHLANKNYKKADISLSIENTSVLKYVQAIQNVFELSKPLQYLDVALEKKLKTLKSQVPKNCNSGKLSTIILRDFPHEWLKKHFSSLNSLFYSEYHFSHDEIDYYHKKNHPYPYLLLVAAAIYKNADYAILEISKYKPNDPTAIKPEFSKHDLINAYIEHRGNIEFIANAMNRSYRDMMARISRMNLPTREINKETFIAVENFYQGENIKNLVIRSNIDYENFSQLIRTLGPVLSSKIKKTKVNNKKSLQFDNYIASERNIYRNKPFQQ